MFYCQPSEDITIHLCYVPGWNNSFLRLSASVGSGLKVFTTGDVQYNRGRPRLETVPGCVIKNTQVSPEVSNYRRTLMCVCGRVGEGWGVCVCVCVFLFLFFLHEYYTVNKMCKKSFIVIILTLLVEKKKYVAVKITTTGVTLPFARPLTGVLGGDSFSKA